MAHPKRKHPFRWYHVTVDKSYINVNTGEPCTTYLCSAQCDVDAETFIAATKNVKVLKVRPATYSEEIDATRVL